MKIRIAQTGVFLALGLASAVYGQSAGQDMKNAGTETKAAAKDAAQGTGKAVKTGAQKTTHATKKVVHKVAKKADQGAAKVEDKTK